MRTSRQGTRAGGAAAIEGVAVRRDSDTPAAGAMRGMVTKASYALRPSSSRWRSISPVPNCAISARFHQTHSADRDARAPRASRRRARPRQSAARPIAEQDRQRDEAALAERAGDGPRLDAAADVDLQRDHQQRAASATRRAVAVAADAPGATRPASAEQRRAASRRRSRARARPAPRARAARSRSSCASRAATARGGR